MQFPSPCIKMKKKEINQYFLIFLCQTSLQLGPQRLLWNSSFSWYVCTVPCYLPNMSYLTSSSPIPTERTCHNAIQQHLEITQPCCFISPQCHKYYLKCLSTIPNVKTLPEDSPNTSFYTPLLSIRHHLHLHLHLIKLMGTNPMFAHGVSSNRSVVSNIQHSISYQHRDNCTINPREFTVLNLPFIVTVLQRIEQLKEELPRHIVNFLSKRWVFIRSLMQLLLLLSSFPSFICFLHNVSGR